MALAPLVCPDPAGYIMVPGAPPTQSTLFECASGSLQAPHGVPTLSLCSSSFSALGASLPSILSPHSRVSSLRFTGLRPLGLSAPSETRSLPFLPSSLRLSSLLPHPLQWHPAPASPFLCGLSPLPAPQVSGCPGFDCSLALHSVLGRPPSLPVPVPSVALGSLCL